MGKLINLPNVVDSNFQEIYNTLRKIGLSHQEVYVTIAFIADQLAEEVEIYE